MYHSIYSLVPPLGRVKVPFTWSKSLKPISKTSVVVRSWESCFLLTWVRMVRRRERPVVAAPEPETESPASRGSCSGHGVTLLSEPEPRGEQRLGGKKTRRKITSHWMMRIVTSWGWRKVNGVVKKPSSWTGYNAARKFCMKDESHGSDYSSTNALR